MLARSLALRHCTAASASGVVVNGVGATRNMATLREIELRLKSVKNIEKITKVRSDRNCKISNLKSDFYNS